MIPVHLSSSGRSASWPVVVGSAARQTEHDNIDMMLYTVLPMVRASRTAARMTYSYVLVRAMMT